MKLNRSVLAAGVIAASSAVLLGSGLFKDNAIFTGAGAVGLALAAVPLGRRPTKRAATAAAPRERRKTRPARPAAIPSPPEGDAEALAEQMLAQGRYALLLRPQIIANLSKPQQRAAREALARSAAFVPVGEVVLGAVDDALADGKLEDHEILSRRATIVEVEPYFLDRYPVTNAEYYQFVASGGYEQLAIWDKEIWPAMVEFVDQTDQPGPRYWVNGCYAEEEENHPVVGICWYEAAAYARWAGKRLPTDAEWVKAGSWPVALTRTARFQRKYPWGNTMQAGRANLWSYGPGEIVPVDATPEGASVGGIQQLIGNVWEWTASRFVGQDDEDSRFAPQTPMRSLRGGAFDTYFENQATCQFQSGDTPVSRRHNVGFRCAIGLGDLAAEVTDDFTGAASDESVMAADEDAHSVETQEEVTA